MGLGWRDGIATVLVAAGVAVTGSLVNAWAWPLIGDARAGVVAVFILGFAACVVGGGPAWMFAAMREGRMRGPAEVWNPFFIIAGALGALAFALMFADLFINDVSLLIWATVAVVAIWLVTTTHHALETRPQRITGEGTKPPDDRIGRRLKPVVHEALSLDELAVDANVDTGYLRRLIEVGAIQRRTGDESYGTLDARRVEFFRTWEDAGFPVERVLELVRVGQLSTSWLEEPVATRVGRLGSTYAELCAETGVPLAMIRAVYQALGFSPPEAGDLGRDGDGDLMHLVRQLISAGVHAAAILGILRVYAVGLRRIARAESELYESEIELRLRRAGLSEQELMDSGAKFMDITALEKVLIEIYRWQREHVWIDHRIAHAELAMTRAGLHQAMPSPPAICFIDLSGYTRAIEERGDEVAAQLAARLTPVVEEVSRRHGGRPIRWLGDGGMFHFRDPAAAVFSGLDMVECVPDSGLPPVHIGIHAGPVIFHDGDVYGMTVNLAARLAAYAPGGQVLVSGEVVRCSSGDGVVFESLGEVALKGVSAPVAVHRALRGSRA